MRVSKIVTEPYGGIGNRLLTIASLFRIARKIGADLQVVWVNMPTVLETSIEKAFQVPFEVIQAVSLNEKPGYVTPMWNNARYFIPARDLVATSSETLRLDYQFRHCVWLEEDLHDFGPEQQLLLTREISQTLKKVLTPTNALLSRFATQTTPACYDLGIHLRVALPDDYRQGVHSVWPDFVLEKLLISLDLVLRDANPSSCFIASPSTTLVDLIQEYLTQRGIESYTSKSFRLTEDDRQDWSAYLEFFCLTMCNSIFRRSYTTYSATAGLVSADFEYIILDDYQIIKRKPLLISGHAL